MTLIIARPRPAPSSPIAAAASICSRRDMPNPTTSGRAVLSRTSRTKAASPGGRAAPAPANPAAPPGSGGSGDKGLRAVCQDRVVVSHKQEGDLKPLRAQLAHHAQAVGGGHPLPPGREGRPLDRDAAPPGGRG